MSAVQTVLDIHTRVSDLYSVPHNQIKEQLRLTIETVSRTFSALRRSGVIAYRKQDEVEIPNIRRLFRMTGSE